MQRRKSVKTTTTRSMCFNKTKRFILPIISNQMVTTFNKQSLQKKRRIILSSDQNKKYKLDSKVYQQNINSKKELIIDLEKKCENLKEKNKFNNEIVNEILIRNKNHIYNNNNIKSKSPFYKTMKLSSANPSVKAKEYKNKKKTLEDIKTEYFKGKQAINSIKNEIEEIDEDMDDNRTKIEQKKNAINGLKYKIIIASKNYELLQDNLNKCENKKKALNEEIIKCLEKQIKANKEKLNDKDKIIKKNEQDINELRIKLEQLQKQIKK